MLYRDIKTEDKGILKVKNQDVIIWESMPNPLIIDKTNFRKFITSFNDAKKITLKNRDNLVSTNDIYFMRGIKIKDINFTAGNIDTDLCVTFVCEEIDYIRTFTALPTDGIYYVSDNMLTERNRLEITSKLNSNLHRECFFYFSVYNRKKTLDGNIDTLISHNVKLRIDFY